MVRILRGRSLAIVLVLLALGGGGVLWWHENGNRRNVPAREEANGRAVPVLTAPVARQDMPIYLNGLGTVQAYNTVTVKSRIDGQLLEVAFREGQDVAAGDVLARIDPRTYQAQYDQAVATRDKDMAQLESARLDLARYISLGNRVTGQTVDNQRATVKMDEAIVKSDQAAIENARAELSYTVIVAPIAGRAGLRQVDAGNIVHASDTSGLVVLTQLQPISVLFTLPQQNLPAINDEMARGNPLGVLAVDSDGKTVIDEGRLETVDNQIDKTTGTIELKAVFPNEKRHLWPGGFVNVRLRLLVRKDSMVVPSQAVQRGPKGTFVYVVKADNTVEMRPVKVAVIENGQALLDEGVTGNEIVVTDGMARLQPGSPVTLPGSSGNETPPGAARRRNPAR